MDRDDGIKECAEECEESCAELERVLREPEIVRSDLHELMDVLAETARKLHGLAWRTGATKRKQLLLSASRVRFGKQDVGGTWDE
jgi:hypothetical protein